MRTYRNWIAPCSNSMIGSNVLDTAQLKQSRTFEKKQLCLVTLQFSKKLFGLSCPLNVSHTFHEVQRTKSLGQVKKSFSWTFPYFWSSRGRRVCQSLALLAFSLVYGPPSPYTICYASYVYMGYHDSSFRASLSQVCLPCGLNGHIQMKEAV